MYDKKISQSQGKLFKLEELNIIKKDKSYIYYKLASNRLKVKTDKVLNEKIFKNICRSYNLWIGDKNSPYYLEE